LSEGEAGKNRNFSFTVLKIEAAAPDLRLHPGVIGGKIAEQRRNRSLDA
jgi:hypothetical protein